MLFDTASAAASALTNLARLARRQDHARAWLAKALGGQRLEELAERAMEVTIETGDPIGEVLAQAVDRGGSITLAKRLARSLADDDRFSSAVPLRKLAIVANRKTLRYLEDADPKPGPEERSRIAALAHNLGSAQKDLGLWKEARKSLEYSVRHYRHLGDQSALTVALNNLAAVLSNLGRWEEALNVARETVSMSRGLSGGQPGPLTLADALVNLCGALSDLDRPSEALEAIEEAVELYRSKQDQLDDFENHRFATALICLGNQLNDLGRYEEAVVALQEGVDLRRRLASTWQTAFEPDLALALANLSNVLERLGRDEEAVKVLDQALEIFHRAAGEYREAFEPGLAWALSLGVGDTGTSPTRLKEFLELAAEATALFRRLTAEQPKAFKRSLVRSLNALSFAHESTGNFEKALRASDEALSLIGPRPRHLKRDLAWGLIYRCQALRALGRWREGLEDARKAVVLLSRHRAKDGEFALARGTASHELGICLHQAGRFKEAARATLNAVAIFRRLADGHSAAFQQDLAAALDSLGNHQHTLGRLEDALTATREAVELFREVRQRRGEDFEPVLASSLSNLGLRLYLLGRLEEALDPAREAVDLFRAHPETSSRDAHRLADGLHNLGTILDALDRDTEALEYFEEAVELRRALLRQTPDPEAGANLARSLTNLGKILNQRGDVEAATAATREAVELFRRAVEEGSDYLRPQLAMALSNFANQVADQGRWQESVEAAEEAVRLLLPFFLESPAELQDWMMLAMGHYLRAAEATGVEVDSELFAAIADVLKPS